MAAKWGSRLGNPNAERAVMSAWEAIKMGLESSAQRPSTCRTRKPSDVSVPFESTSDSQRDPTTNEAPLAFAAQGSLTQTASRS